MKITDECAGCRACEQRCPRQCIHMNPDTEGFLTAVVDDAACIECGLCIKICPQNHLPAAESSRQVWAVRLKDGKRLYRSASGGAFAAIAQTVLEGGGAVFGAAYGEDLEVVHIRIDSLSELEKLQGSKYVQSDTAKTYAEVKSILAEGRKVFYTGTPCQIGGLKAYLGKSPANLLTADLVCHGVPSPRLFADYLLWLGDRHGTKILRYDFRDKRAGWGLDFKARTLRKSIHGMASTDPYYSYFLKGFTYRECCYSCRYAARERTGDFTLGDYWGIEREHPGFFSVEGVSLLLLNSAASMSWMERHKELFFLQQSTFEQAAGHNRNLLLPTRRPSYRDTLALRSAGQSPEAYFSREFPVRVSFKSRLKNLLPARVRKMIKKIKH